VDCLAAHREEAAAALFVDLAGELVREVDVGLVALHHPLADLGARRQLHAAELDAAVGRVHLNSTFSSKSFGSPPRQIRNVFCLTCFCSMLWPTMLPFSARQNDGSPSQPFNVLPSKIDSKPAWSSSESGSAPRGPSPRPPRPRPPGAPCGGGGCAARVA